MDILRIVVQTRSKDKAQSQDTESLGRFSTRVAKLRGEGPMATSDEPEVALEVVSINIKDIEIPPNYPRKSSGSLDGMVASIRVFGLQQPIKVAKIKGSKKYRLVFGRRRLEAADVAGLDAVPCIVELVTKEDRLQMLSLVENTHRCGLHPIEEGPTFQELVGPNQGLLEEVAKNLGVSPGVIKKSLEFLTLPTAVRKEIASHQDRFPFAMMEAALEAFQKSKNHGKKLMAAIISGEVTSYAQAKKYIAES